MKDGDLSTLLYNNKTNTMVTYFSGQAVTLESGNCDNADARNIMATPASIPVPSTLSGATPFEDDPANDALVISELSKTRQEYVEKANAFEIEEELRQELRKARRYRGRLRGQLSELHEQMDNLVKDDDETRKALKELERREVDLRQALKESMMYVVELERRDVELMRLDVRSSVSGLGSVVGRRSARSSVSAHSMNKANLEDIERQEGTGSPRDVLIDKEIGPEDSVSACVHHHHQHHQAPIPFTRVSNHPPSTRVPPGVAAAAACSNEVPSDGRWARRVHQGGPDGQAHTYRPFCDGATIGKLTVLDLKESFRFAQHCKHLEELLYESGAGEFKVTPSLGQAFHPFGHLRHACIQKLLASLQKCPAVLERAQSAFSTYGNEWSRIVEACMSEFSRRSVLSLEMEKRMRALKFGGVREVDNYIKDCVCAFEIYRQVFPHDRPQHANFVRRILAQVPKNIAMAVVKRCRDFAPESATEWETCVPVHSLDGSTNHTIVEFLKEECRLHEEADRLVAPSGGPKSDSVRLLEASGGQSGGQSSVNPREWVKKYAVVCGITGKGCRDRSRVEKLGQADGILARRDKFKRPYYLLGYHDKGKCESRRNEFPKDLYRSWIWDDNYKPSLPKTLVRMNDELSVEGAGLGRPSVVPSASSSSSSINPVVEDSISAVAGADSPPNEVVLRVSLKLGSGEVHSSSCLVDTGAGGNYLIVSDIERCRSLGVVEIPPVSVSLADGTVSRILYGVCCSIAVSDCDGTLACAFRDCQLRALQCPGPLGSEDRWQVLAGRDLINSWGLVLYGTRRAFINGKCVFESNSLKEVPDSPDDVVCRVVESPSSIALASRGIASSSGLESPPSATSEQQAVLCPVASEIEDAHISSVLKALTRKEWVAIPGTKGAYHCRVRELLPCEIVDVPGLQSHVCEIRVPSIPRVPAKGRSYSKSLYSRLSPTLQEEYAALVEGYLSSKWWVETSLVVTPSPPAQIFLVPPPSQSKKSRLVIDFRELNKVLPRAGAGGESPMLFHVLGLLRTESRETTLLCDCRSAFYKIRLRNFILALESALGRYVSTRMGFGVVFGPCGLNGGLSQLVGEARVADFGGLDLLYMVLVLIFLFVDDLALSGPTLPTVMKFKVLLILLLRVGFDAQQRKVHALAVESREDELRSALQ
ncbi:hypothetical protein FOZ62_024761, partial [Perkinsus olseni]